MIYMKDIEQLIRERHSTRTFNNDAISQETKSELHSFMTNLNKEDYRFTMVDYYLKHGKELGTYGFIKNAKSFIVAVGLKSLGTNNLKAVDFGYDFEQIILKATELGIGTCWMGMSFNNSELANMVDARVDEQILMVSPIGYSHKQRGREKLTRMLISADKRKAFGDLFYEGNFLNPLNEVKEDPYTTALEMLRLAPSAGNAQPWRVVKVANGYDFYVDPKKFYDNMKDKRVDLSYNDMGIAKLHFELTANKYGLKGKWVTKDIRTDEKPWYAYSWVQQVT